MKSETKSFVLWMKYHVVDTSIDKKIIEYVNELGLYEYIFCYDENSDLRSITIKISGDDMRVISMEKIQTLKTKISGILESYTVKIFNDKFIMNSLKNLLMSSKKNVQVPLSPMIEIFNV